MACVTQVREGGSGSSSLIHPYTGLDVTASSCPSGAGWLPCPSPRPDPKLAAACAGAATFCCRSTPTQVRRHNCCPSSIQCRITAFIKRSLQLSYIGCCRLQRRFP